MEDQDQDSILDLDEEQEQEQETDQEIIGITEQLQEIVNQLQEINTLTKCNTQNINNIIDKNKHQQLIDAGLNRRQIILLKKLYWKENQILLDKIVPDRI